jgi:hypothetical protein
MDARDVEVSSPIIFLLGSRLLVLSNPAARVLGGIDGTGQAKLSMTVSDEPVDEESRFILFKKNVGIEETSEIATGLFVDFRLIGIHPVGKIDFRPDNVQVAVRAILRELPGLRR